MDVRLADRRAPGKVRTNSITQEQNGHQHRIHEKTSIRAKGGAPFRIIKRQFGFVKARYKGFAENDNQLAMLFTLTCFGRTK